MAQLLEGADLPESEAANLSTDWRGVLEESLRLRLVDLSTLLREARTLLQWIRESRPGRVAVTLVMTAAAALVCWRLWIYYMDAPWTRDGVVRADVVDVAPDVSGLDSEVLIGDNESVKKG